MITLLTFAAGGAVLLALLGRAATPVRDRLPLREWTPVYVADLVGRGFRVFGDAGKERARRQEAAREEVEGRRDTDDPWPPSGPTGPRDPDDRP